MSKNLTVGVDVTWMSEQNASGGVFQYAERLVNALVKYTGIDVVAITAPAGHGIFAGLEGNKNFRRRLLDSPYMFPEVLGSEKIRVVHTPRQLHNNVSLSVPMISTLHDLQHCHYPEFFTAEELRFRNTFYRKSAEFSERVMVSFRHVKEDIVKFYDIPPEKIDVCPFGTIEPRELDDNRLSTLREEYGIPDKYIFYSANTWPHKNHIGLIRALKLVHEKYSQKIPLVCTGHKHDEHFGTIQAVIDELGLDEFVNFTGYLPEEDDMLLLLKNATLAVIPTLYEAGSFPLLEAMAYEVPVVCSNVTSLPDTIGDLRFLFDPKNEEQMAEKIHALLTDEKLVKENRENSRKRAKEGGWETVVNEFVEAYYRAIESFEGKRAIPYYGDWILNYEILSTEQYKRSMDTLRKQRDRLRKERDAIRDSLSWKITKPVRYAGRKLKR